ncbi:MAG: DUF1598 domain-containing protein [Planctomycetaceae bacterium]|nr:DUF1598 domain-containing protein [Planctomycetaceae bacterium]
MSDSKLNRIRQQSSVEQLPRNLRRHSKLRKIALGRLEANLTNALESGNELPDEITNLAGLTQIRYVFVYPATSDKPGEIVLAGPAEPWVEDSFGRSIGIKSEAPTVQLEDLVAALRVFPPGQPSDTLVGCSIDPTQEGLASMQAYLQRIGTVNPQGTEGGIVRGLREALGPQTVTVQGVSPHTHFAQVLVEADYRMKLIGIGLEKPPVRMSTWIDLTSAGSVAKNALQRWFFTPNYECLKVSEDDLAIELVGDGVKLIGADEMVLPNGRRISSQQPSRASKLFTQAFTLKYPEIARQHPVYAQLKTLIDLAVVAAYLQEHGAYESTEWSASSLLDEGVYPIERFVAPQKIDCAVNAVRRGSRLLTPIGGGVVIMPRESFARENLQIDETGTLYEQHNSLKIPVDSWYWD